MQHTTESARRCAKCLLPDTFPNLQLDADGTCSFCLNHRPHIPYGEQKLRELMGSRRGDKYDCVVPFSGGKDSTYVLCYAVERLNLRAIAVNYDSGLQSAMARENMVNVCERLGVRLVFKPVNRKRQLKMLRAIMRVSEAVEIFFRTCGNCETGIRSAALGTANEYKAPFILMGDTRHEHVGSLSFTGMPAFLLRLRHRKRQLPKVAYQLAKYSIHSVLQRAEMGVPLRYRFQPFKTVPFHSPGIQVVHFFDYVRWDPEIKTFIKEHLGWKAPEGHESRFDCLLHCFGNFRWLHDVGVSHDGFILSALLRAGRISSEELLASEAKVRETVEQDCRYSLEKIGVADFNLPRLSGDRVE